MRNTLKWASLLIALCFASTPFAGAQTRVKTFVATGSDSSVRLIGTGIYSHRIIWQGSGTRTSCQIKLEQSVDNSTWSDLIANQTCTTDGSATVTGWANYVRMTVSTLTGASNTVTATYVGASVSGSVLNLQDGSGNLITSHLLGSSRSLDATPVDANGAPINFTADVVHGDPDANPPVKTGAYAAATEIAAVDAADVTNDVSTLTGAKLVQPETLPQDQWQSSSAGSPITNTTFVLIKDVKDNYYYDVTAILVTNSHATVGTVVKVVQGTGTLCGTNTAIIHEGYAAPVGGGWQLGDGAGVIFSTTAVGRQICIAAVTTGASITWSMKGSWSKLLRAN